jgi:hypothetical protein
VISEWGTAFIGDGYTVTTTIPGVRGLHPPCKMTYRPALHAGRTDFRDAISRAVDGNAAAKQMAEHVGKYVQSWDLKNDRQQEVSHKDVETVQTMQPELFEKVLNCINGYRPAEEATDIKNSFKGSDSKS